MIDETALIAENVLSFGAEVFRGLCLPYGPAQEK